MLLLLEQYVTPKLATFIFAILVVLTMSAAASAQTSASRKLDEFVGEVDYEDLIARLDNFALALMKEPNAQGQIILYRTRRDSPAIGYRYALRAKDYLVRQRRMDGSRLVTVDGGMTGCLMYELWIVPAGAAPPERRFTYKYPLKPYAGVRKRR
jgi:hypothetical protein